MSHYRIVTVDGFILASVEKIELARAAAQQQARQLGEPILIRFWDWSLQSYQLYEVVFSNREV